MSVRKGDKTEKQRKLVDNFPYPKEGNSNSQSIQEKIDFYWALKTAKSTREEINNESQRILEQEFDLKKKNINGLMHEFKDFEIKYVYKG